MSEHQSNSPASAQENRLLAIARFFTTLGDERPADSIAHRDAALLGFQIVATCVSLTVGLVFLGRFLGSLRIVSNTFITAFVLLIAACAAVSLAAVLTLLTELINWWEAVRFEKERARSGRAHAEFRRNQIDLFSTPAVMPAVPDVVLADLENYAIQKRDEAFREATRIAYVLNRLHEEISHEQQR